MNLGICRQHDAKLMVKGKSMVSEEVELNHAMDAAGIEALESDMGEYIVQLAGEKPSHIIMPAIHKTKQDIAAAEQWNLPIVLVVLLAVFGSLAAAAFGYRLASV